MSPLPRLHHHDIMTIVGLFIIIIYMENQLNRLSVVLQHSEQFHEGVPKEALSHHSRKEHIKDSINPPLA